MLWGGSAVAADVEVEAFVSCDESETGKKLARFSFSTK